MKKNKYLPQLTYRILESTKPENFYFIFNFPDIVENNGSLKISMNKDVDSFFQQDQAFLEKFLKNIKNRIEDVSKSLENSGFSVKLFQAECNWRLVIGLGASHPQETSMTLHHIYGVPYIPGSAVKGVTRHWWILKEFDSLGITDFRQIHHMEKILEIADVDNEGLKGDNYKLSKEEFKKKFKIKDLEPDDKLYNFLTEYQDSIKLFRDIFGTQEKKGKVIFFDAYPVGNINLKIDIMNPHYSGYYNESKPPADWQKPNPIKFLTVEKTKFQFFLASKDTNRDIDLLCHTIKALKQALKEQGVGAKTSLGYGLFDVE